MKEIKFKWRADRRGLEIAMNMVVAVIVAVTVLGLVLYWVTTMAVPPKSPPNVEINPKSILSGTPTLVTIRVTTSEGKAVEGATVHLSGLGVTVQGQTVSNLPATTPVGNYAGTITASLGQDIESGKVKVTVTSSYPEAIANILVYKPA